MELAIIGGGPAGLTAAIYALRAGYKATLFEKAGIGGQAALTYEIENYPSHKNINGWELTNSMMQQAVDLGLEIIYTQITNVKKSGKTFVLSADNAQYKAKSVILAMGATHKKLGIEGDYEGRGVSYCATCDGNFYRDKPVAVVGGGNTAVEDALYLSKLARKVYLIHRRDSFRAGKLLVDRLHSAPNVELVLNSQITALGGEGFLSSLTVQDNNGQQRQLQVDGLFVAVGQQPQTQCVEGLIALDNGYVKSREDTLTRIKGLFVAGDCRSKHLRQVVTACADGAVAAEQAASYLSQLTK